MFTKANIRRHVYAALEDIQAWEPDPNAIGLIMLRKRDVRWLLAAYRTATH